MDDIKASIEDFLVEAFELIEQIDQDLVERESNPEDLELLNRLFRVAHTLKGSSSFLNFDVLTKLTHHMEDVLNKARRAELTITPDVMDVVLESSDMMKALLIGIRDYKNDTDVGIDIADICARLGQIADPSFVPAPQGEKAPVATPEPEVTPEPKVEEKAPEPEPDVNVGALNDDEVEAEIERLLKQRKEEDKERRAKKIAEVKKEKEKPAVAAAAPAAKKSSAVSDQTIRVEVKRLDDLMNLIGELVLGKNRLMKIYDDVEERYDGEQFLEELNQVVSAVSIVTTDIQIAVMKTRMLPIAKVFNKFPRMVRDLSRELGKSMDLEISGEETELDKSIVE